MKKLGLALGAGGARGIAHIGFLKALEDNGIKPDFIAGTSMGSVIGSFYALGFSPSYMIKTALALKPRELLDVSPVAIKNGTLLKSKKMSALLRRYLHEIQIEDLKIPFACVGLDIISGEKVVFTQGDVANAVQASSSIPMVFAPIAYENMLVADGGPVCRVPIQEVKDLGADVVVGVDVLGPVREMDELKSIFGYILRIIDVYDSKVNELNLEKNPPDILCTPDLGNMSQYKIDSEQMQLAYKKGYESAINIIDELKRKLNS
ncbi:MAG: patatin-like phospholipase family protein [Clostridia bacterium]|nr:patatin-like phospholipase family protein [Clostridia bacterium]